MTPDQERLRELERLTTPDEVGFEIITPWKLEEYMAQLDAAIHSFNLELVAKGSYEGTTAKGFNFAEWAQFLTNWNGFKARVDDSYAERWLSPGVTYNRAESYHQEYRQFREKAKQLDIVQAPDPMPRPEPAEEDDDNDNPWSFGPSKETTSGLITVGGIFALGYLISQMKR